jgi:uncharacterized protein YkwD
MDSWSARCTLVIGSLVAAALAAGCGASDGSDGAIIGAGGSVSGTTGTGGSGASGADPTVTGQGGSPVSSGGQSPAGGSGPSAGADAAGGSELGPSGGAASGGDPSTGGSAAAGGALVGSGGSPPTGGVDGSGGNPSTGGLDASGGANTGGSSAGGSSPTGGTTATGGSVATGGSALGGSAGDASDCPPAPAGASAAAVTALQVVNEMRVPAGAGCATMVAELNLAAQNHCDYYAANEGSCIADAHSEVAGCTGFTGESPGDRMQAAGYTGSTSSEVMAFSNDPERAVQMWINSVWHRLPVLSPWVTELGYGNATGCDTMDFGRGTPMPDETVVVYPYAGQAGVPTSFRGDREGPEPLAPPTGWPSGVPITVYARSIEVTEHVLTVDGDTTPIDHVWLTSEDSSFLRDAVSLYAYDPLAGATSYRVTISGTHVAGALSLQWSFTTE